MGFKNFKTRQEYEDETRSDEDKKIEEKIRMLRKQQGKKAQRRKCEEESSAPKRRKTEEEVFKSMWSTSRDGQPKEDGDKRKADEEMVPGKHDQPERKVRKTQTIMDKYLIPGHNAEGEAEADRQDGADRQDVTGADKQDETGAETEADRQDEAGAVIIISHNICSARPVTQHDLS